MGHIKLTAADGHTFDAYRADPEGTLKGGIVVIQEIFGVNSHIREVTDGYARDGYSAIAPAIFDRTKRDVELNYDPPGIEEGREIAFNLDSKNTLADIQAAVTELLPVGKVGVVGYCFGGTMVWASAANLSDLSCAVGYYGGGIAGMTEMIPQCPTMLHFGEVDPHIPLSDVDKIKNAHTDVMVHVYEGADHGFNCDHRGSYQEAAAKLAKERTLAWISQNFTS